MSRLRSSSLHMLSNRATQPDDLDDLTPIEEDIKYYVKFTPYYKPGYAIHVSPIPPHEMQIPLFHRQLVLECPPKGSLPFCDPLCMRSLLGCLSLAHIQEVVSTLLRDGQVLLHSRNVEPWNRLEGRNTS